MTWLLTVEPWFENRLEWTIGGLLIVLSIYVAARALNDKPRK
jgi:hypothetical protein